METEMELATQKQLQPKAYEAVKKVLLDAQGLKLKASDVRDLADQSLSGRDIHDALQFGLTCKEFRSEKADKETPVLYFISPLYLEKMKREEESPKRAQGTQKQILLLLAETGDTLTSEEIYKHPDGKFECKYNSFKSTISSMYRSKLIARTANGFKYYLPESKRQEWLKQNKVPSLAKLNCDPEMTEDQVKQQVEALTLDRHLELDEREKNLEAEVERRVQERLGDIEQEISRRVQEAMKGKGVDFNQELKFALDSDGAIQIGMGEGRRLVKGDERKRLIRFARALAAFEQR